MKLSNKILLGFFGFIFLYLTAAFAELRMTGIPNIINRKNSMAETVNISGVTYLKVTDVGKEINIIGSDRAELEVLSFSGNVLKKLTHRVSGDTLMLSGLRSEDANRVKISVFVPKAALKGIAIDSSAVTVQGLESAAIDIVLRSAAVWMDGSNIGRINVSSAQSVLEIAGTKLDTLSAESAQSQINIYTPVRVLQGSVTNTTSLRLTEIAEIHLKKDESSKLTVYQ